MSEDFVPEADAIEQELPVQEPDSARDAPAIEAEVPEADAIEQAQPGPLLDEDDAPR